MLGDLGYIDTGSNPQEAYFSHSFSFSFCLSFFSLKPAEQH
jgi:hypothetical protein